MKKKEKRILYLGIMLIVSFAVWTVLVQVVDVQSVGQNGTDIGFASFNVWFHKLTGVNRMLYTITDWLGLVPLIVCLYFAGIGLVQWCERKSLFKIDCDIILLGMYYIVVIFCYLIFEIFPINYRPILIEGIMEASYPSSTTLLVLSVMSTLNFQMNQRVKHIIVKKIMSILVWMFSGFMVISRIICGVHWFTDIVGSVCLSAGLFCIYKAVVLLYCKKEN